MICCTLSCHENALTDIFNNKCSSIQLFIEFINRHSTEIIVWFKMSRVCFWLRHGHYKSHKQYVMFLSLHMTCTSHFCGVKLDYSAFEFMVMASMGFHLINIWIIYQANDTGPLKHSRILCQCFMYAVCPWPKMVSNLIQCNTSFMADRIKLLFAQKMNSFSFFLRHSIKILNMWNY